jgi:hypothetical protein
MLEFFQFMTLVIVSLAADKNQWVNCGQVDADGDQWYEIKAAFKLEKQPSKVTVTPRILQLNFFFLYSPKFGRYLFLFFFPFAKP